MGGDHCAGIISTSLKRIEAVRSVETNVANHKVTVRFDAEATSSTALKSTIERAGYDVSGMSEAEGATLQEVRLVVPGMGSDHCAGIISASIRRLPGIAEVITNIANHGVTVRFDPRAADTGGIRGAVEHSGYDVAAVEETKPSAKQRVAEEDVEERYLAQAWKRLWIAAVPMTLGLPPVNALESA